MHAILALKPSENMFVCCDFSDEDINILYMKNITSCFFLSKRKMFVWLNNGWFGHDGGKL